MIIRKVEERDCDQLIDLLINVGWFNEYFSGPLDLLKEKFIKHINFCIEDNSHSLYAAEEDDKIITGYISVHWLPYLFLAGPEGYISELFIREKERGKGTGKKLLETVKYEALERGCSRLSLLNGRNRESYNRSFYQKQGFIERDQLVNYILKL
jgi:GNAT superfamily N-acetyltransferase